MISPSDGSVEISSEKVDQDKLKSIDGFDSGSTGFDFAIAFAGDSDRIEVSLRVSWWDRTPNGYHHTDESGGHRYFTPPEYIFFFFSIMTSISALHLRRFYLVLLL